MSDDIVFVGLVTPADGAFTIEFPDLPGCGTFAPTFTELLSMAKDAMVGWLVVSLVSNEGIPASRVRESDPCLPGSLWVSVGIPRAFLASQLLDEVQNRKKPGN